MLDYSNIQLSKPNFEVVGGYYYTVDNSSQLLLAKTADSTVAFSYPLSTPISNIVETLCYDGYYWWTLEQQTGSVVIRKWLIQNYIFNLIQTQTYTNTSVDNFTCNTMAVEHYNYVAPSGGFAASQTDINLGDNSRLATNDILILGPSTYTGDSGHSYGQVEFATVSKLADSSQTDVVLVSGLQYSYEAGDPVQCTKNIWLFNNYFGTTLAGGLYKIDKSLPSSYTARFLSGEYYDVTAATFYNKNICFVLGTVLLFLDPTGTSNLNTLSSMQMDNIQPDNTTIVPVSDLSISNNTAYRLQQGATYTVNGVPTYYPWGSYNYQAATLKSFIRSISLIVDPGIMAADGTSTANVIATVRDQYFSPMSGVVVTLSHDGAQDGTAGFFGGGESVQLTTRSDGTTASNAYTAGTTEGAVTITAKANQPVSH